MQSVMRSGTIRGIVMATLWHYSREGQYYSPVTWPIYPRLLLESCTFLSRHDSRAWRTLTPIAWGDVGCTVVYAEKMSNACQVSIAQRRVAIPRRQVLIPRRQVSIPQRQVSIPQRQVSISQVRDTPTLLIQAAVFADPSRRSEPASSSARATGG